MTNEDKIRVKRALDRRAREQQPWWDEYEAEIERPSDPARDQIDEYHDLRERSAA